MQSIQAKHFRVQGMTCGHCVRAITRALLNEDLTADVQVDLGTGEVRVVSRLPEEKLIELIREEGYPADRA